MHPIDITTDQVDGNKTALYVLPIVCDNNKHKAQIESIIPAAEIPGKRNALWL